MPLRVYLDTSVFSAYYDEAVSDRRTQTEEFWERRTEFEVSLRFWLEKNWSKRLIQPEEPRFLAYWKAYRSTRFRRKCVIWRPDTSRLEGLPQSCTMMPCTSLRQF